MDLNGVGPLRVQQALHANGYMGSSESSGGKVIVISTGMASIGDNGSGGYYAYRGSKGLVNMVTKSMAANLNSRSGIRRDWVWWLRSGSLGKNGRNITRKVGWTNGSSHWRIEPRNNRTVHDRGWKRRRPQIIWSWLVGIRPFVCKDTHDGVDIHVTN